MAQKLEFAEFSKSLLITSDLDPTYVALYKANLDRKTLMKVCLAYWAFYHLGVAAKLGESSDLKFWKMMKEAAINEGLKWPRGSERRHYRGQQAVDSVSSLLSECKKLGASNPHKLVEFWCGGKTLSEVSDRVQKVRGFGPWISFKIADMAERILGCPVEFSLNSLNMYSEPRKGAALVRFGDAEVKISDEDLESEILKWEGYFRKYKAPPSFNRQVNVQEVETMFCKYKSHFKGHYPVGKDTTEIYHALSGWGDLAEHLRTFVPVPN